jgi:hypothetical protein
MALSVFTTSTAAAIVGWFWWYCSWRTGADRWRGLQILGIGYGAYWLVRRYRRKSENASS